MALPALCMRGRAGLIKGYDLFQIQEQALTGVTQRKIFDPFFYDKGNRQGNRDLVYIVHSIINNLGGYINLDTQKEALKGTFNSAIYVPRYKGD